jgi:glucans biosynthesis protein C
MRKYYIDWLRIFLIVSVFFYHVGMLFNTWEWHIKNNVVSSSANELMIFLHTWRMPLLFLISGAGTFYALGKRTKGQYIGERTKRLLLPVVFGMLLIVPPQVYVEKIDQYDSYFHFYSHLFNGSYPEGNTSWHHLWFVVYLFFFSLLAILFISFFRSKIGIIFMDQLEKLIQIKGGATLLLIPLILSQIILRPYFPNETHGLLDDWAFFTYCFLFFIYGYVMLSREKIIKALEKHRGIYLAFTIISTSFFLAGFKIFDNPYQGVYYGVFKILVGWFCSLTVLGYAKKYLSFDHPWRVKLNEGIYPFYILHQTVIVVSAYFIVDANAEIWVKYLFMSIWGICISVLVYLVVIRPYNLLRVLFGMKPLYKSKTKELESPLIETVHSKALAQTEIIYRDKI